jgi:DNA-binding NtrC family response regulator
MIGSPHALVIDDEAVMRDSCREILEKMGFRVRAEENGEAGLGRFSEEAFDLVLLDLKMPGMGGQETLVELVRRDPEAVIVVITGYATVQSAVEAMRTGAYDFLPKPFTPEEFRIVVRRAIERRELLVENRRLRSLAETGASDHGIVGESAAIREVLALVERFGPTDSTVLVLGESGTGKELVARALHAASPRSQGPFVAVDCGTINEGVFESELFGHVRGAFTGAVDDKVGRFEQADGGTLFLDEIGSLSLAAQARLLRAIAEREVTRVGDGRVIRVDVRIVAATNRDLEAAIREGEFREDLDYRLRVCPIELPPLRDRREDVPLLAEHFLRKYDALRRRRHEGFTPEALDALRAYPWPGNVRELENVVERAVILADDPLVRPSDILLRRPRSDEASASVRLEDVERRHVLEVLGQEQGNKSRAAEVLGIDRKTLREKLRRWEVE